MWYFEKLSRAKWSYIRARSFRKLLKHLYLLFMLFTCLKAKTSNVKELKVPKRSTKRLKYTNWNERSTQMVTRTSIFTRLPMMRSLFKYSGMEARMMWFVATKKVATLTINAQNVMDFVKKVKSGYVAQCAKTGITKNVSISDDYFIFFINFTWCLSNSWCSPKQFANFFFF